MFKKKAGESALLAAMTALSKVIQHQTNALVRSKRKEAHFHLACFPILMWVKGLIFSKSTFDYFGAI